MKNSSKQQATIHNKNNANKSVHQSYLKNQQISTIIHRAILMIEPSLVLSTEDSKMCSLYKMSQYRSSWCLSTGDSKMHFFLQNEKL